MIFYRRLQKTWLFLPSILLLLILAQTTALAQELNCVVIVNDQQVQTTERRVFRDMENAFAQFLNSRKWTNDNYNLDERINCTLALTMESMPSIGNFTATVQIQSSRPIYNTNFESILLNYADREWQFQYVESLPLDFNENNFTSNLTALLAFYAYVIIGMDYDSFSEFGGEPYFEKALNIVTQAQQSNASGWNPFGGNRNSRYWLIENLTNQQLQPVRKGIYTYHRLALDTYLETPEESRNQILEVLENTSQANQVSPNSVLIRTFFTSKSAEIINIFKDAQLTSKRRAVELLTRLDPGRADEYQEILSN